MPSRYRIAVTSEGTAEQKNTLIEILMEYNRAMGGEDGYAPLTVLLHDEDGAVVGGLYGATYWGWLYIEHFSLRSDIRRQGWGFQVLSAAETEARRRNCHSVYLDTFDFQARPFYEKHGYTVFGTLDDFPPGHQRFFLKKRLTEPRA